MNNTIKNQLNPKTLKPFNQGFQYPSGEEIKALINQSGFTGGHIGELIGVNPRRVREWQGLKNPIYYSEWRLLSALLGLIKLVPVGRGPKTFVVLYIENGQLKASVDQGVENGQVEIIGNSTISVPFNVSNTQEYLNQLISQAVKSDEPLKAFGQLAKEKFEQSGGLAPILQD